MEPPTLGRYKEEIIAALKFQITQKCGGNQAELCRRSGLKDGALSRLLNGHNIPNTKTLMKIAQALNMSLVELLTVPDSTVVVSRVAEARAPYLPVSEPQLPVAIPVVAEGPRGEDDGIVDYAYWPPGKVAHRAIRAIRLAGDALQPSAYGGDTLFVDANLAPQNGDIVLCLTGGTLALKRYRLANGNRWMEDNHGKTRLEDCELRGVVVERCEKFR